MEFTEEVYHIAFDKALSACDEAAEALYTGAKDDKQLADIYRATLVRIRLITERWEREGYGNLHGSLIDNWFKRIRDSA